MENLLLKYMEESFHKGEPPKGGPFPPFVTISREYGCPSKLIGQLLVETINKRAGSGFSERWRFINKEILEESAHELQLPEMQIKNMLNAEKKGVVMDILTFSTSYGGTERIRKTLQRVIRAIAYTGHVVIIGRGGVAVTRDFPNSLHIKLQAPLEWRVKGISEIHGITLEQARRAAGDIDTKRANLIGNLLGKKAEPTIFDVIYNCMYLTTEEIVQSIIGLMEVKKMI